MGSIVHRSVPTNLKWLPNCSHAHALFQDRLKDVQVGSRWFSKLYILSPNFHTVSYALDNSWTATLCADKRYYLDNAVLRMPLPLSSSFWPLFFLFSFHPSLIGLGGVLARLCRLSGPLFRCFTLALASAPWCGVLFVPYSPLPVSASCALCSLGFVLFVPLGVFPLSLFGCCSCGSFPSLFLVCLVWPLLFPWAIALSFPVWPSLPRGLLFFLPEPVAFRRVYGLEAYSRTSGESNHHRQCVSVVKNDALPTEPRGHLPSRITVVLLSSSVGSPCWCLP